MTNMEFVVTGLRPKIVYYEEPFFIIQDTPFANWADQLNFPVECFSRLSALRRASMLTFR